MLAWAPSTTHAGLSCISPSAPWHNKVYGGGPLLHPGLGWPAGDSAGNLGCCCFCTMQAGADVDAANCNGVTPLMLAAKGGHAHLVKLLLDSGASVWLTTEDERTALHKVR